MVLSLSSILFKGYPLYSHRHFCFDKADFSTKWPNFTMPFNYVKVPKSKNELTRLHVGQKHPFTQKIRSLAQKRSILTQNGVCQNRCAYDCINIKVTTYYLHEKNLFG